MALERFAGVLGLGHVQGPGDHVAALQGLGGDPKGPALPADRRPAYRLAPRAHSRRLLDHRRRAPVEHQPPGDGVLHGGCVHGVEPGPVRPDQPPLARADPGRLGQGVKNGGEPSGARQAAVHGDLRLKAKPDAGSRRPPVDGHEPLRPAGLEGAGLAGLEQGGQPPGIVRPRPHQGVDHRAGLGAGGRFAQAQDAGAEGQAVAAPGQGHRPVLDGQHGAIKGFGGRLGGVRHSLQPPDALAELGDSGVGLAADGHRPQGGRHGQANPARRRGDDQVGGRRTHDEGRRHHQGPRLGQEDQRIIISP